MADQLYIGVDHDVNNGLTHLGRMVRDAWVLGILDETETCAGWSGEQMQNLYEKVYAAWEPYAHQPSCLPEDLQQRHKRIYDEAITAAKKQGWSAELNDDD